MTKKPTKITHVRGLQKSYFLATKLHPNEMNILHTSVQYSPWDRYLKELFISFLCVSPLFQSETFLPYGFHQANGLRSFIRILLCLNNRPQQVGRRLLENILQLSKGAWPDVSPHINSKLYKSTARLSSSVSTSTKYNHLSTSSSLC